MNFKSTILIIPGLGNSGETHWQTLWQKEFGFTRINQQEWNTPVCSDWIDTIDRAIVALKSENIILVGHSLACSTIGYWSKKYNRKIKGALLVGPSDTEADTYPAGTTGFAPMPVYALPFKSIVVASSDDFYVGVERATLFARNWGSTFINIGNAGHINVAAGYGKWDYGLELLQQLDKV
jgi:predicted alpha/beta hydrolase family esterase